ncbi:hypothetical protein [Nocardiopsis valliformis]|uniref:hypothetical protein n=1 Tax=Nocardiopsis valliformis TaxID=239974 RepID=UPI0012681645|nr:hypothetical protein [Nocardiopsis valliformis]
MSIIRSWIEAESATRLELFLREWYGTPTGKPINETLAREIPEPLRRWHELYQLWETRITHQNHAIPVNELAPERGKIPFWSENQGNFLWAFDPENPDSKIYEYQSDNSWRGTHVDISRFLDVSTVNEAAYGSPIKKFFETRDPWNLFFSVEALQIAPLKLGWPHPESRTVLGSDWLALVDPGLNPGTYEVIIASKSERSLRKFMPSTQKT